MFWYKSHQQNHGSQYSFHVLHQWIAVQPIGQPWVTLAFPNRKVCRVNATQLLLRRVSILLEKHKIRQADVPDRGYRQDTRFEV